MKKIVIIDYGRGNLRSVAKALEAVGASVEISSSPKSIGRAGGLLLPGVGAFGDAMGALRRLGWVEGLKKAVKAGKPLLGVCLGLQVLFENGLEFGPHKGLGFFSGTVRRFGGKIKIPHMGWNQVWHAKACPLFKGLAQGENFYFVHSYRAETRDSERVAGTTAYGNELFVSAVWKDQIFATQFHPEKSQKAGLKIYKNYWDFVKKQ